MGTYICMAESLHCSPETTTTLLIGYTQIQNKKLQIKPNENKCFFKKIFIYWILWDSRLRKYLENDSIFKNLSHIFPRNALVESSTSILVTKCGSLKKWKRTLNLLLMILAAEQGGGKGGGRENQPEIVGFLVFLKGSWEGNSVFFFSHWIWKAAYFGPIPSCGWDVRRWSNFACITMRVKMLGLK